MIDDTVAALLAQVADVGLPERIEPAIASVDPVLRGAVRTRVLEAVESAKAKVPAADPDHQLALAFLLAQNAVGAEPAAPGGDGYRAMHTTFDVADGNAVATRFRERAAPFLKKKTTSHRLSLALAGVVLTAVSATAFVALREKPSPEDQLFQSTLGVALNEPFTNIVVDAPEPGNAAAFTAAAFVKQVGPGNASKFQEFFAEIPKVAATTGPIDQATASLFAKENLLNEGLLAAKLPVVLHSYSGATAHGRAVWATAYYAPRTLTFSLAGIDYPLALGRRIDGVNLKDSRAVKLDAETWGIVSLNVAEEEVATGLVQPLGASEGLTTFERSIAPFLEEFVRPEIEKNVHLALKDLQEVEALRRRRLAVNGEIASSFLSSYKAPTTYRVPLRRRKDMEASIARGVAAKPLRTLLQADDDLRRYRPRLDGLVLAHASDIAYFFAAQNLEAKRLAALGRADVAEPLLTAAACYRLLSDGSERAEMPNEVLWSLLQSAYDGNYATGVSLRNALGKVFGTEALPPDPASASGRAAIRALFTHSVAERATAARNSYALLLGTPLAPLGVAVR
jgi:hypothetical protein